MTGKRRQRKNTAFSEFIRNAPEAEKRQIYMHVMKRATQRQLRLISD